MNIESCANTNWISTIISMPNDGKMKIIQVKGLPLPTFGIYNTHKGKWNFCQAEINENHNWEVIAWRNMPEPYVEEVPKVIFRSANETRDLSLNVQHLIKEGTFNTEFYHIRMSILDAAMSGKWNIIEPINNPEIKERLIESGFSIRHIDKDLYEINWGIVSYEKENEEHYQWRDIND